MLQKDTHIYSEASEMPTAPHQHHYHAMLHVRYLTLRSTGI